VNAVWLHPSTDVGYDAICEFVAKRIWGKVKPFSTGTAMAIVDGEKVVAGVIFNNYDPDAGVIEISAASDTPRWLTSNITREMFNYSFDELGCQAVVMRVATDDTRVNRILKAWGFERYDIPRLRGRDEAEAVFVLGDDVWRDNKFNRGHK